MKHDICRLGYVAFNVANFDECVSEAQEVIGINLVENNGKRAVFTSNRRYGEYVLYKADRNAAKAVGLEAYDAESVAAVAKRARAHGMTILTEKPSLDVIEASVTLETVNGHVIEVHTPMPSNQPVRHLGAGIHPRYIDHVNLKGPDPAGVGKQFEDVLHLRLSDMTAGREIVWYRAGDGRHHTLAMLLGDKGIHHISWEFAGFSEFQRLGDILALRDRRITWGPGRHGPGDNLFSYYIDPTGVIVECCAEMEYLPDDTHPAGIVDPGENLSNHKVLNQWGTLPSKEWLENHLDYAPWTGWS